MFYALYESDNFHSSESSVLIGIFDDQKKLNKAVKEEIEKHAPTPEEAEWQYNFYIENKQTQKLSDIDFRVEAFNKNKIKE